MTISSFLAFGLKLPNHAHFWGVLGDFGTVNNIFLLLKPPKGTSLGESALFGV